MPLATPASATTRLTLRPAEAVRLGDDVPGVEQRLAGAGAGGGRGVLVAITPGAVYDRPVRQHDRPVSHVLGSAAWTRSRHPPDRSPTTSRGERQADRPAPSGAHDRHDYDELRALLPPGLRSIALDWPAHGESPAGDGPASAMRFADIAEELVEQLAPDGAVVVGNSVGGFAATRLAIRRPELVSGLVIIDGGGFVGPAAPGPRLLRADVAAVVPARDLPWFANRYMRPQSDADRRVRDAGVATTREDPGLIP